MPRLASSIEAYADLVVALFAAPYSDEVVMARYDLPREALERLHDLWRARFADDPALASRWLACRAAAIARYQSG